MRAALDRRPDINVNKLQQFLHLQSVHTCRRLGRDDPPGGFHHAVYTPPYECDTQPIELVWARVKRHVADRFSQARTLQGIRDDVVEGFFGEAGAGGYPGVTPAFCCNIIRRSFDHDRLLAEAETRRRDSLLVGAWPNLSAAPGSKLVLDGRARGDVVEAGEEVDRDADQE